LAVHQTSSSTDFTYATLIGAQRIGKVKTGIVYNLYSEATISRDLVCVAYLLQTILIPDRQRL
jgi:hypothetical protein